MNPKRPDASMPPARASGRRHPLVIVLAVLLALEALTMIAVVVVLVFDTLTQPAASLATAVALTVLVALGAVWISAVTVGVLRGAPWSRGGALYWQLIQLAIAVGAFQGVYAQPAIGWLILVPSVIVLIIVFSPPVTAALRRPVD